MKFLGSLFSFKLQNTTSIVIIILLVLVVQNIFIFFTHYFDDVGFPWDFVGTYLAVPYYWIEAARSGYDASWIPFQGMGYPLYMNLQSGYFYPPNWLFVIFDMTYTIHTAIVFQGIHVFVGALGAVFAAKILGLKWHEALVAGVLYQCFGAFYSNAEHVDIIRAYAFTPWIIIPFIASKNMYNSKLLVYSILFLPFWILFMWTGGYIGVTIAVLFTLGILLVIRMFLEKEFRHIGFKIMFSSLIGFLLSAIYVLPALMDLHELTRSASSLRYDYFHLIDIFSLIYPIDNKILPHDVSMRSNSIGVFAFILLVLGIKYFHKWNFYLLFILALALLMGSGVLHHFIINIIPQLGLSRFTMADYRGLVGLSLILLSVSNMKYIKMLPKDNYLYSALFIILFVVFGNIFLHLNDSSHLKEILLLLLFIALTYIALLVFCKNHNLGTLIMIVIVILDWSRIHGHERYWYSKHIGNYMEKTFGSYDDSRKTLHEKFSLMYFRGKRLDINKKPLSYSGYYNGNFLMNDYGGSMKLQRYENIRKNDFLKQFAILPWRAIRIKYGELRFTFDSIETGVHLKKYGTSRIVYSVSLDRRTKIVENEIFWHGWKGYIEKENKIISDIEPFEADGFRGWDLPAGKYFFVTEFKEPHKMISLYILLVGIVLWIFFAYYLLFGNSTLRKNSEHSPSI